MHYQAVLFDFDYTLGDATDSIYEGYCHGFAQMGLSQPSLDAVRHTVGYVLEDGFTMLTGDDRPERREEFRIWFQKKVEGRQAQMTRLFPGAEELLHALHREGIRTGIVTSKRVTTLNTILERYGLLSILDFAVGCEGVTLPKPDPQGLELAVSTLEVAKSEVLYCGDTILDAGTAQNAGVDFAAVLNGITGAEAFASWPSVHIAPDLVELRQWLHI